ncbi:MAG: monovalent cation/H+ antiporter complex subunit F [Magnetovibrionaceae bacterium]
MDAFGQTFLDFASWIAFACLLAAFGCSVYRLVRGPSFADRVVALDFLMLIGIGFITVKAIVSSEYSYIDVAIAMALVGFLATVAFARYIYRRAQLTEVDPASLKEDTGVDQAGLHRADPTGQGGMP